MTKATYTFEVFIFDAKNNEIETLILLFTRGSEVLR